MKRFIVMLAMILVANIAFAQAQRTFVKSFNLKGDNQVVVNLDAPVEVKEWDQDVVRVLMNVSFENANDSALRFFTEKGRYRVLQNTKNGTLTISAVPREGNIKYQGRQVEEVVTYTVLIPGDVNAEVVEAGTASAVGSDTSTKQDIE